MSSFPFVTIVVFYIYFYFVVVLIVVVLVFLFLISVLFTKVVHSVMLLFYHKFAADDQTKRLLYIAVEQWKQWIVMINERCLCCSAPATENHLPPAIITPLATIPMSS